MGYLPGSTSSPRPMATPMLRPRPLALWPPHCVRTRSAVQSRTPPTSGTQQLIDSRLLFVLLPLSHPHPLLVPRATLHSA